jgi:predicted nucleotidyltransferase
MKVDLNSTVAGYPMRFVRTFLKEASQTHNGFYLEYVSYRTKLSENEAEKFVHALVKEGFLELGKVLDRSVWTTTIKGNALAMASTIKPMTRKEASVRLAGFLDRVAHVNTSDDFLYRVIRVTLFGSYLSSAKILNDIDLCVELERKEQDGTKYEELAEEHLRKARSSGRNFRLFIEELCWPERQARDYLKNRSRRLNLMSSGDSTLKFIKDQKLKTKVIYTYKATRP